MRNETCSNHFGYSARPRDWRCLFRFAHIVRPAKSGNQPSYGSRYRCSGRITRESGTCCKLGARTSGAAAASTCRAGSSSSAVGNTRTSARTRATASKSEAQAKAEAQTKSGQKAQTQTRSPGCTKTKAKTTATRRIQEIAQGSDEAQKKACAEGRQESPRDREAAADTCSICLCTPSSRERIIAESPATNCPLLEYSRWCEGRSKNENKRSDTSKPGWIVAGQATRSRYGAFSERSIISRRCRKRCSRTFESTLQSFAITLWSI